MVLEVIEPINKRVMDDRDKIVKIRSDFEAHKRRFEDLEFSTSKIDSRLGAIDDLYKKNSKLVSKRHLSKLGIEF